MDDQTSARTLKGSVEMASKDRGLEVVEGDGDSGVKEGVGGQKNGLRPVRTWTPARVGLVRDTGH